jgi:hypothetical protein
LSAIRLEFGLSRKAIEGEGNQMDRNGLTDLDIVSRVSKEPVHVEADPRAVETGMKEIL